MTYVLRFQGSVFRLDKVRGRLVVSEGIGARKYYVISLVDEKFVAWQEMQAASSREALKTRTISKMSEYIKKRKFLENAFEELENVFGKNRFLLLIPVEDVEDYKDINNEKGMFDFIFYAANKVLLPTNAVRKV